MLPKEAKNKADALHQEKLIGLVFFYVFSKTTAFVNISLLFLREEDNGDHKGDYCGGEEVNAKLTDKVGYEGLACLRLPNKGNALVGYEMEEEIVDYEYYR